MSQPPSVVQRQTSKPNLDLQSSQKKTRTPKNYETPTSSSKARVDQRLQKKLALKTIQAQLEIPANQTHIASVKTDETTKIRHDQEESHSVMRFNGDHSNSNVKLKFVARGNLKEIQNVDSAKEHKESLLSKSVRHVISHAELLSEIRQSPERYQDTKSKVICHNESPKSKKGSPNLKKFDTRQSTQQNSGVKIQSTRIKERESQISQKEAELTAIMQEIETKRNQRLTGLNQAPVPLVETSPQCKATYKTYDVVHDCQLEDQSSFKFELDGPEEQSSSNLLIVQKVSPAKENFQSPQKKFDALMNVKIEEEPQPEKVKVVMQSQQRIISELYKPILKNKQNSLITTPAKSKSIHDSYFTKMSYSSKIVRPLSSISSNPLISDKSKDKIERSASQQGYKLHTISSKQRIRTLSQNSKSPARHLKFSAARPETSPAARVQTITARPWTTTARPLSPQQNPQPSASAMEVSPRFGASQMKTKLSSNDIDKEYQKLQGDLEKQRNKSISNTKFYENLNKLTYGDDGEFKKHGSPNSRLMKQKNETVKQKHLFRNKEGQQYVVGVDKGYVVKSIQKLDYNLAEKKPMEFVARLEQQELTKTKLKKEGGKYVCSEKTSKRNIGVICENARQAILEAKGTVVVVDGVKPTRF